MDRKNRNRAFAAALVCVLAAGMVTGCANPRKAGAQAMEEGQYEEAVTQFQQAAESENRETAAEGCRGLAWPAMNWKTMNPLLRHSARLRITGRR